MMKAEKYKCVGITTAVILTYDFKVYIGNKRNRRGGYVCEVLVRSDEGAFDEIAYHFLDDYDSR